MWRGVVRLGFFMDILGSSTVSNRITSTGCALAEPYLAVLNKLPYNSLSLMLEGKGMVLIKMLDNRIPPNSKQTRTVPGKPRPEVTQLLPNYKSNLQLLFQKKKCLHMKMCPYIINGLGKIKPL